MNADNGESDRRPVALITGASSGIGAAFARALAAREHDLVLVARREARLRALAAELVERHAVRADVLVADLATEQGVTWVEQRIDALDAVDVLINNAGFGTAGPFAGADLARQLAMIHVHVLAPVRLTHRALPGMLARRRGAIVNVSSIAAFVASPGNATYSGTKAYLKAFTEALWAELRGSGVRVQALCPGFTRTEFHDSADYRARRVQARVPAALWMRAADVVAESLRALQRDHPVCVPGLRNRVLVAAIVLAAQTGLLPLLVRLSAARLKQDQLVVQGGAPTPAARP